MEEMLDADVYALLRRLIENPRCVFGALSRYPYTLLHGDFRAENVAYTDRPVAFDWQEASCSLMTIDLAWLIKVPFVRNTLGDERAIRYYRARLEGYLNQSFDDAEWQAMVGLGYLVDALRSACFEAYFHKQRTINPSERDYLERAVVTRNQQTRGAMRWLHI